ncbi:hypothetical protein [Desulfitibacter alkalitolerans]|uniref:hypothetical protein n=1 Tax=Desulfitibacter alkalitolerans TaxID=264641 RepID=UPI00047F6020|nr:hypothetical protein [Desulfitibacter alkalitolerans]
MQKSGFFDDSGKEGRSKFSIVIPGSLKATEKQKLLPHHTGDEKCPYLPGCGKKDKCSKGYMSLALKQQNFQEKDNKCSAEHNVEYTNTFGQSLHYFSNMLFINSILGNSDIKNNVYDVA